MLRVKTSPYGAAFACPPRPLPRLPSARPPGGPCNNGAGQENPPIAAGTLPARAVQSQRRSNRATKALSRHRFRRTADTPGVLIRPLPAPSRNLTSRVSPPRAATGRWQAGNDPGMLACVHPRRWWRRRSRPRRTRRSGRCTICKGSKIGYGQTGAARRAVRPGTTAANRRRSISCKSCDSASAPNSN